MHIDVFFGVGGMTPADVSGRLVLVIDALRAATTIAVALANDARAVIPFDSSEEVITRAKAFQRGEVALAGERKMLPVPGFDFGNSPREFTREAIAGKTILMSTTNGTAAISAAQGARDVIIASYVNFSAVMSVVRAALRGKTDIAIICAGRAKQFALEDAACAGRYVRQAAKRRQRLQLNDAAQVAGLVDRRYGDNILRVFEGSTHGRALKEAGFADDLVACAELDAYSIIPVYQDRQITKLGPNRAA